MPRSTEGPPRSRRSLPSEGALRRLGNGPAPPEVDAFIGLGANLGDRAAALAAAMDAIAALPGTRLVARSSVYESAPQGDHASLGAAGGDYLNAVVRVATTLDAHDLLRALHVIEARHGRERPYRHAPRSLDLDLLVYGEAPIAAEGLVVPHPRLAERAFVVVPLAEIAPDLVVPGVGAVAALLPGVVAQRLAKLDR